MRSKGKKIQMFPRLDADERSVIEQVASCKNGSKAGWRDGRLFLTEKRLFFGHDGRFILTLPFNDIRAVRIKGGLSALVGRKLVELTYKGNGGPVPARVLLSAKDAISIAKWLCRKRKPSVREDGAQEMSKRLDEGSQRVLQHLVDHRHASTLELGGLWGIDTENVCGEVDRKVNTIARNVMGMDLIVRRAWWFDPKSLLSIRDRWWLSCALEWWDAPEIRDTGSAIG